MKTDGKVQLMKSRHNSKYRKAVMRNKIEEIREIQKELQLGMGSTCMPRV